MNKKILRILTSLLITCMCLSNQLIYAATYPGDSFTVTLACKSVEGSIKFNASNATITGGTGNWCDRGKSFTVTAKATAAGSATISLVGVDATDSDTLKDYSGKTISSKTITVSKKTSGSGSSGGGTTTPSTPKSSDNTLKSLTVSEGTLSPAFSSNTTEYTLELGPSVSKINVKGVANHDKASISGNGDIDLTVGENIIKITVTAENGNPKVYKIKAIVDDAPLVFVKFNETELGVVRNLDSIPKLNGFEETTVKIEDKEINAWYSQQRNITVLYLQNEDGKDFYLYDETNGIQSKYTLLKINGKELGFIDVPKELQDKNGFTYQEITINDKTLMGWVFNNESFKDYSLIYAMDENGKFNFYQYENTQQSLQLYSNAAPMTLDEFNEELNKKEEEINSYKQYFYIACGGAAVLFLCLIISIINSNRYKKRLMVKTNRENKVD